MERPRCPENIQVAVGSRATALLVAVLMISSAAVGLFAAGTRPDTLNSALSVRTRPVSTYVNARVLAANTAETETAPTFTSVSSTSFRLAVIVSASCADYYININTTAAVPAADVSNGDASERNPTSYDVAQGEDFSVVAPTTCIVTFSYYPKSY